MSACMMCFTTPALSNDVTFGGGDGSNPDKAVEILNAKDVDEAIASEHIWFAQHPPLGNFAFQALVMHKDRVFDEISFRTADGISHNVFFDLTPYDWNHEPTPPASSSSKPKAQTHADSTLRMPGTTITVRSPKDFVDNSVNVYMSPPRPFLDFELSPSASGGDTDSPEFLIERVVESGVPRNLDDYVRSHLCDKKNVLAKPKTVSIDGAPGYEFATTSMSLRGGTDIESYEAPSVSYEIVFDVSGVLYHCVMTEDPGHYKKYLNTFEAFCGSVRLNGP